MIGQRRPVVAVPGILIERVVHEAGEAEAALPRFVRFPVVVEAVPANLVPTFSAPVFA